MPFRSAQPSSRLPVLVLAALLLVPLSACRRFTKAGADREVYKILRAKRRAVPQVAGTLDIEAKERLADAIRKRKVFDLSLEDALALATVSSREYRQQREEVYLTALDLTRELNVFRPQWTGSGSTDLALDPEGSSIEADVDATLTKAFETGGSIVFSLASDFLRNIMGDPLRVAQTILAADVVLPLARGSGRLVAQEALVQAERDTLYALRSYARFQQEFTVEVASRFYRALQLRDAWENAELAHKSLQRLVDEQNERADAGRLPEFEVDQARQSLLEADDDRQRARNRFDNALDQLKLDLGIPLETELALDDSELKALREAGPQPPPYTYEDGIGIAADKRLDLRNGVDQEEDARRRILVTRNALGAQVDLRLGANLATPGEKQFDFRRTRPSGNWGLDIDLPLERTAERNVYRRAIIQRVRARRARERLEDLVALEVRDAYRSLAEANRSYEIQVEGANLAERRVESTQMLLELGGRLTIRDRLEAEDARVRAKDAVTAALVDHALARLAVARDVGTLRVDAEGSWEDGGVDDADAAVGKAAASSGNAAQAAADLGAPPAGAGVAGFPPPAPPPGPSDTVGGR